MGTITYNILQVIASIVTTYHGTSMVVEDNMRVEKLKHVFFLDDNLNDRMKRRPAVLFAIHVTNTYKCCNLDIVMLSQRP